MITLNQHQNTLESTSMRDWDWDSSYVQTYSHNGAAAAVTITYATKLIMCVDLTDMDGFSGFSTVGNNELVDINFDSDLHADTVSF
jgi:hypothetical protein